MNYVTFGTFETRSPLLTSDYLVGYKTTGPTEIKTQVKDILDLIQDSDAQTLSFNESNNNLTISSGNTVSLSSLSDLTVINTLTGQLVTNNSFNNYQTSVANSTATLLPITTYQSTTGSFATNNFVQTNFFPLSGGTITGETRINNNLTVNGNLTATGTTTFANTVFSTTSSLSVVHIGSGPAIWVGNNGAGDIASFYDIDQNIEILHVGGNNGTFPNVGVKTSVPNKTLTVAGEISATSDITTSGKIYIQNDSNSDQWNKAYNVATAYQSASATLYAAPSAIVEIFTSSRTWTKPLSAKIVHVVAIGGGGGGGSGRYDSASTARAGGGGGGGGAYSFMSLNAAALSSTVSVTVGASGAGGVAQTSLAQNGNPGGAGGDSSFGTILRAAGGAAGPGGTNATGSLLAQAQGIIPGGLGGVGQLGSSTSRFGTSSGAAGGGGGGGGCNASNANTAGGDGGVGGQTAGATAGTGGATNGGAGGNASGTVVTEPFPVPGSGGGGGGGANTTNGGAGGNGLNYGGGGGGGAGSNGSQSGAGGNGGVGIVVVTTYF